MKIQKGDAGYIKKHKRNAIIKTALEFGIVIALLVLGMMQTKTRLNLLTIVAVLGGLPAAKALVEVIMIVPHQSIAAEKVSKIEARAEGLTLAYDLVLTTEKKILPIDCVAISGNTICGLSSSPKTDVEFAGKHIKQMLYANQFTKVSVKIFEQQDTFLTRVTEMAKISSDEENQKAHEEAIKRVILNLSL